MKKKFLWVLAIVVICASCLFACSPIELKGGPSLSDTVFGNGGSAVVKGNYLYFANAYKNYEELGVNDNKYNDESTKIYGIYRTKLNDSGSVDVSDEKTPSGAELMVPLISGYSKSGLYICGEYLYYTTPYSVNLKGQSSITTGYLRFERVKLNGTDRQVLSQDEFTKDYEYNINYFGGTTYITVFGNKATNSSDPSGSGDNSSKDISVLWFKNDGKSGRFEIKSATTCATYLQENIYYNKDIDNVNKYVYYTKNENSEYSLYRKPLQDGNEEFLTRSDKEIKLVSVKNNRVYFKIDNILYSATNSFNKESLKQYTDTKIQDDASSGIVNYLILDDTSGTPLDRGIIAVYKNDTNYSVVIHKKLGDFKTLYSFDGSKQINLIFTKGQQVFYTISENEDDNALYAFDYETENREDNHYVVVYNFKSGVADGIKSFDYDVDRIFFFDKVENSNQNLDYLQIALLENNMYKNDNNKSVANYIGKLHNNDIKKEEDE